MTMISRLTPDELDARARSICADYVAHGLDAAATHCEVAALVYQCDIPQRVAGMYLARFSDTHAQAILDLGERLRNLIVSKILINVDDGTSSLDPRRVADGASLAGWMRRFLLAACPSEHRNYRRQVGQASMGAQIEDAERAGRVLVAHRSETKPVEDVVELEAAQAVVSAFVARARGAKPVRRLHLQAEALRMWHDLPQCTRPHSNEECDHVLGLLDQAPTVAFRVVSELASGRTVTSPVAELFAGFSEADLETLAGVDPRVAQTLAKAAASARPPQPRRVVEALRERLIADCSTDMQRTLAESVLTHWLAASTTMDGDEHNGWVPKSDEQQADELAAFTASAHRMVLSGFPATSAHALYGRLMDLASDIHRGQSISLRVSA